MLNVVPTGWFTPAFIIVQDAVAVAVLKLSVWRETAEIRSHGTAYTGYRAGGRRGPFVLESDDAVLARAVKLRALVRSFEVAHGGTTYVLAAESAIGRAFILHAG